MLWLGRLPGRPYMLWRAILLRAGYAGMRRKLHTARIGVLRQRHLLSARQHLRQRRLPAAVERSRLLERILLSAL
jgi:hypothetical protein